MLKFNPRLLLPLVIALITTPVLAQTGNFGQLTLALGFKKGQAVVTGHTGGAYSLSSIANKDYQNNPCIGFGDPNPDHIMVLENDFSNLTLSVASGGNDTTLVVRGPDGIVRCGDDTGSKKDASIESENWPQGTYEVWIGSFEAGKSWNYRLVAQEK
jgi:hypothetical protein